jgi:pyruvate dehydrogenase E1 component beta subunit
MTEKILSCSKALSEALHEEMARDERVFLIGEDITAHGGNFGQFGGLYERFGERVIDTPISETAIAGAGVGAALTGMRPVVDLYFADFLPVAMDEIVNQTAISCRLPWMRSSIKRPRCDICSAGRSICPWSYG